MREGRENGRGNLKIEITKNEGFTVPLMWALSLPDAERGGRKEEEAGTQAVKYDSGIREI